jgi:hypothetical protein
MRQLAMANMRFFKNHSREELIDYITNLDGRCEQLQHKVSELKAELNSIRFPSHKAKKPDEYAKVTPTVKHNDDDFYGCRDRHGRGYDDWGPSQSNHNSGGDM